MVWDKSITSKSVRNKIAVSKFFWDYFGIDITIDEDILFHQQLGDA